MKGISDRIWLLALGVAVAIGIAMAAFLLSDSRTASFSVTPGIQKTSTASKAAVIVKGTLEKVYDLISPAR